MATAAWRRFVRFWREVGQQAAALCQGSRHRRGCRRLSYARPRLENLEDRTLLATITWTNPLGGAWNVAGNWDLGRVPGAGDDVVINRAVTNPITYSSG